MDWDSCTLCPFGSWGKKVYQRGDQHPDVLFVGEAPGKSEEHAGVPFVGVSGRLLDRAIEEAGWKVRGITHAIVNVLLCRPSDNHGGANRTPTKAEVLNCAPRLAEHIGLLSPSYIVSLGKTAASAVSARWHLYHPAYILRKGGANSAEYKEWVDKFQEIAEVVSRAKTSGLR